MSQYMKLKNDAHVEDELRSKRLKKSSPLKSTTDIHVENALRYERMAKMCIEAGEAESAVEQAEGCLRATASAFLSAQGLYAGSGDGHHNTVLTAMSRQLEGALPPSITQQIGEIRRLRNDLAYPTGMVKVGLDEAREHQETASQVLRVVRTLIDAGRIGRWY